MAIPAGPCAGMRKSRHQRSPPVEGCLNRIRTAFRHSLSPSPARCLTLSYPCLRVAARAWWS